MKLLIMKFFPVACYVLSLRSKYTPQHAGVKHPTKSERIMLYSVVCCNDFFKYCIKMSQVLWLYGGRRERGRYEAEIHKMGIIQIIRCSFMQFDFFFFFLRK
jgi:hypothetical protein